MGNQTVSDARVIKIEACKDCPFLDAIDLAWDFKLNPVCQKTGKSLTKERIDIRFDDTLKSIPEVCPLPKENP